MAYIITYDLCKPGQNYDELIKSIKSYENWCRIAESAWVIITAKSSMEIAEHLETKIDKGDKLFVGKLSGEAAWSGESNEVSEWLKKNL